MRYLGGKNKQSKTIAGFLESLRTNDAPFFDVFAGSLAVTAAMSGDRTANDASDPLINMYLAWLDGWRPPHRLSEKKYRDLSEKRDPKDPLTAFAGFGLSYGGKWFGGYAGGTTYTGEPVPLHLRYKYTDLDPRGCRPYNYTEQNAKSLNKKMSRCLTVRFTNLDFGDVEIPDGSLVYLDPVYRNSTDGYSTPPFEHERFFDWAATLAGRCTVVLSEFEAGDRWQEVWSRNPGVQLAKRTDRMFMIGGSMRKHLC